MEYGTSGVTVGASNAVSASWVAASGFNLTGAFSGNDSSGDPTNIYLKAGFKQCDSALVELGGKKPVLALSILLLLSIYYPAIT